MPGPGKIKLKDSMWDGVRNYQARNNLKKMKKLFFIIQLQKEVLLVLLKL